MTSASAPPNQIAQFRSDGITASTGLRIPFYTDLFSRSFGEPDIRLINTLVESTPIREETVYRAPVGLREIHYSRPGLVSATTRGPGPCRGLFSEPGVFAGAFFMVSGSTFYNDNSAFGACPGSDYVRFAASRSQVVGVSGGVAYLYTDGTSGFAPIVSSVLPPVSDVAYLAGRFVYTCAGSDTFYYSAINDAANVGGLNFATAESYPDANVGVAVLNEELVFFGASSVEFWQISPDADAPFTPVTGGGFQRGCVSRDSIAFVDNSLFWVAPNRVIYRAGPNAPARISSSTIEDKLRQCVNVGGITAWGATFEGHELYVVNLPGIGSYAYDASRYGLRESDRGEWGEWRSWNRDTFRGQFATVSNGSTYIGDPDDGTVWKLTAGAYTDGADPLVRVASAFIKVEEGTPRCANLVLHGVMGVGNASDPGADPIVEMRYSDDDGHTFADWRKAKLGRRGQSFTRAFWQRLGTMRAPGRLVEIRCSEPVLFTLSHLELNAARPAI
jgi:hypothetical protein